MDYEHHRRHHYYNLFSTLSEFLLVLSLHGLASLHLTTIAYTIAVAVFTVYTAVTAAYLKRSVVIIRNINQD
jgi:hypothetical protein